MHFTEPSNRGGQISFRFLTAIAVAALLPILVWAGDPSWWSERGVTNGGAANDYAAANQGQVKNIATQAIAEFNDKLASVGGAGVTLNQLAITLSATSAQTNDYAPINLGQLKMVAKPFYDRLIAISATNQYPWAGKEVSANDYAMANIGQVKNLFAFDLWTANSSNDIGVDGGPGNGLPDWWEKYFYGDIGVDPLAAPDRSDCSTIKQAFEEGKNPLGDGVAPTYTVHQPTVLPMGGRFFGPIAVTVRCVTPRAELHFTLNGSDPDQASPTIDASGTITLTHTETLKVRGYKTSSIHAFSPSTIVSAPFYIGGSMAAGDDFTLLRTASGAVVSWGRNWMGQLGTIAASGTPQCITSISNVSMVAAGADTAFSLNARGAYTWGDNSMGLFGNGALTDSPSPVFSSTANLVSISASRYHGVAVSSGGSVSVWGDNSLGQLGISGTSKTLVPLRVPNLENIVSVGAGETFSVALCSDGTLMGWGDNRYGQLGSPIQTAVAPPQPVPVAGYVLKSVAVGAYHCLALTAEGAVLSWGANWNGQLGNQTRTGSSVPTQVSFPENQKIVAIAAGRYHSLAIGENGVVYAWGANWSGQIGNNSSDDQLSPTALNLSQVVDIIGGLSHTVAILGDGTVWAWGSNAYGQLGRPGADSPVPMSISGLTYNQQ